MRGKRRARKFSRHDPRLYDVRTICILVLRSTYSVQSTVHSNTSSPCWSTFWECANEHVHTSWSLLYRVQYIHATNSRQIIFQYLLSVQNTTSSLLHAILPITWIYTMYILATVAKSHLVGQRIHYRPHAFILWIWCVRFLTSRGKLAAGGD